MFYHLDKDSRNIGLKINSDPIKARDELSFIYNVLKLETKYSKDVTTVLFEESWYKKGNRYSLIAEMDFIENRIQFFYSIKKNYDFIRNKFGQCSVNTFGDKRYDGFRKFNKANFINGFLRRRQKLIKKFKLD